LDLDPSTPGIQTSKTVPEGTFSINPDASVKFVPTAGFNGPVTPITYALKDSSGQVTNGTIGDTTGCNSGHIASHGRWSDGSDATLERHGGHVPD
jgi:hypothetical protein